MQSSSKLLISLKNAANVRRKYVFLSKDRYSVSLLTLLCKEGFIAGFKETPYMNLLKVRLKYSSTGVSCFNNIHFFYKSDKTIYFSYNSLCKLASGTGLYLINTKDGVLTNQECIRKKLGGVGLCYIT
jgi:ribosomal protein S8|tara:strand:- start:227 stop:610 length:384 start_codon:yes stop_codon:yes gene_type:complete